MARGSMFGGGQKKKKEEADLDITPMIDVTFLLLIFFMVTSTMQKNEGPQPPTAQYGDGTDTRTTATIQVSGDDIENPELVLGDQPGTLDDVVAFARARAAENVKTFIIKADKDVRTGVNQEIARRIMEVEGVEFRWAVRDKFQ